MSIHPYMNSFVRRLTTTLAALALLSACGPQPDPTTLITKARIIGANFSVEGDPERTSPMPGETVNVSLLITQKTEPVENTWVFIVCEPAPTAFGISFCAGEPIAFGANSTPTFDAPSFPIAVPESTSGNLLIVGAVCMGGLVNLDIMQEDITESANPCVDEGVGQLITGDLLVADEDFTNQVPRIAEVRLDGEPWTDEPPTELTGCAGGDLRQVQNLSETKYEIEVVPVDGSRESYILTRSDGSQTSLSEELPVAFYATDLGLSGLYSVIDGDPDDESFDATPIANVTYKTLDIEDGVGPEGRVIRFEMVMRDDRGGSDRVSRALCLVP